MSEDATRPTRRSDWKTSPLPKKHVVLHFGRDFSRREMVAIERGFRPTQMEDKWFVYVQDDQVYFHRSWTGYCVYVARLRRRRDRVSLVEVAVSGDPKEHDFEGATTEAVRFAWLFEFLLLGKERNGLGFGATDLVAPWKWLNGPGKPAARRSKRRTTRSRE